MYCRGTVSKNQIFIKDQKKSLLQWKYKPSKWIETMTKENAFSDNFLLLSDTVTTPFKPNVLSNL